MTESDQNVKPENTEVSLFPFSRDFNLLEQLSVLFSTALGFGFMPIAPGTWGSLFGVGIFYATSHWMWQQQVQLILAILLIGVGSIAIIHRKVGPRDDGRFVIDEVVGMMITLLAFPPDWRWMLGGFLLFRLLDIWKPFPARYFDGMHGAWGVMLDDVVSGIYALAILRVIDALRVFL